MILRNRKYLDWLREQRCIISGMVGNDNEGIDPMHIGTAGKGIKAPDNEAIPVRHWLHVEGHQNGEISMLRKHAPDHILRSAFRALAREMYSKWEKET